ncbi:uncharacterized protein LOC134835240 [Culicoides brevitarsis]|uniref:uncharacterized protein LOC134835240 n=1 Tax=Culicoides brevitarsis TaxID=469753 RepID=UPI00307C6076
MKKSSGIMQPMCCSDKNAVIESKIDPQSVAKGDQRRWNFYKRNKNRKKTLVDQAEQCNEDDIQKCLSDNVVAVPKNSNKDKIHKENERFTADLHKLIQNNSQTIDPFYNKSNQNQMPATVNNFMIHMNGQQYNQVPYGTTNKTTTSPANNIFIVQTENNQTRITIVQASEPPRTIFPQTRIEEVESEGDLSHDSLDDLVMGHFEYREKAVDVPDNFEPDSLMIDNSLEDVSKEQSPFKRRLNAPPLRQSRGFKNKTKTNPHQYFRRDKDAYNRQWINAQQLDSSTLDRNSILHWSGDATPKFNPAINFKPIPEQNPGTLNRRNANSLKKLGISCQNLSSGRNSPERNVSAKSLSKNLSKSEHDLCRKTSTDSTTSIKASVSRFDIMTKFFSFNKNNKIEPITSVEIPKAGVMDFTKRAERVGWMKNISNYFAKKTRRSTDRQVTLPEQEDIFEFAKFFVSILHSTLL